MNTHTETEIRKSFVNCSKGAAQRINIPQDVLHGDWESQIFLGWYDPKSPRAASSCRVVREGDGVRRARGARSPRGGGKGWVKARDGLVFTRRVRSALSSAGGEEAGNPLTHESLVPPRLWLSKTYGESLDPLKGSPPPLAGIPRATITHCGSMGRACPRRSFTAETSCTPGLPAP